VTKTPEIENLTPSDSFFLMAGPCVVENTEMPMVAVKQSITDKLGIPYIFKHPCKAIVPNLHPLQDWRIKALECLAKVRRS